MEFKTLNEQLESLCEAKIPDEGETFKLTDDVDGVDEVNDKYKVIKKNQELKRGSTFEVVDVGHSAIFVKAGSKLYGFLTAEWKTLPIRLV